MKTKRSNPADDGGKTTATAVAPSTKPKPRELTKAQAFIADELGSLLLNGGRLEDLDGLIKLALTASKARCTALYSQSEANRRAEINELVADELPTYRVAILSEWKRRKSTAAERPAPKTVTARIRASILDELNQKLEYFLETADPEECRLMIRVMDDWLNVSQPRTSLEPSISLGEAFALQLDENVAYIKVPLEFKATVEKYVSGL